MEMIKVTNDISPVLIVSKRQLEAVDPVPNSALIRVSSDILEPLPILEKFATVLNLIFDDVVSEDEFHGARLITQKQAESIALFLSENRDKSFVFCCDGGVSRSSGIALAFTEWYPYKDLSKYIMLDNHLNPNPIVYLEVRRALDILGKQHESS